MSGLVQGLRRAWVPLTLALVCFVLAWPAFQDLERLLIGLGVLALLVGLAIVGFTAAHLRRGGA